MVHTANEACTFDQKIAIGVDEGTQKPNGTVVVRCSQCGQCVWGLKCSHPEAERGYKDNGDGTHTEYCQRCGVELFKQDHILKTEPIKTRGGAGPAVIYNGQLVEKCTLCTFEKQKSCTHPKSEERIEKQMGHTHKHSVYCNFCKKLLRVDKCTLDSFVPYNYELHTQSCSVCGGSEYVLFHDFRGMRTITKVEAVPRSFTGNKFFNPLSGFYTYYDYRIHYTETCKLCKARRTGKFTYHTTDNNGTFNYKHAFEQVVNMKPEELRSFMDAQTPNTYAANFVICDLLLNMLQPVTGAVGWDSVEYCSLDAWQLGNGVGSTGEAGTEVSLYDKNGNLIMERKIQGDVPGSEWSVERQNTPDDGPKRALSGGFTAVQDGEYVADVANYDQIFVGIRGDVLASLEDGEHSIITCGMLKNGERACSVVYFTVSTVNGQKVFSNVHHAGEAEDDAGERVTLMLTEDAVAYTGEAVTPPAVTVQRGEATLSTEDYHLTYYRLGEDENGMTQTEIAADDITELGSYSVVATPTAGAAWSGTAYANFRVAIPLSDVGAEMSLAYDSTVYTGAPIKPAVTVSATIDGNPATLTESDSWSMAEDENITSYDMGDDGDFRVSYTDNTAQGTAVVTVTGEGRYMGTLTKTFTIQPAPVYTILEGLSAVYGQSLGEVALPEGWTWDDPTVRVGDAGDTVFPAAFRPDGQTEYPTPEELTVTVLPKEVGLSWSNTAFTYDGASHIPTAAVTGLLEGDACEVTVSGAQTNAGSYTATATALSNPNYRLTAGVTSSFTIAQAEVGLIWSDTSFTYDGQDHAPAAAAAGLVGGDSCSVTVSGAQRNAGQYIATATSLSNANYKLPAAVTQTFAIGQKQVGLKWGNTTLPYNGKAQAPDVVATGLVGGDRCTVTVTGEKKKLGTYTATASKLSNTNYKLPDVRTRKFTIKKGTISIASTASVVKGRTVALKVSGGAKVTWKSGNASIATVTAKGVVKGIAPGKVTITVKDAGNSCYNKATKKVTVTVMPASPTGVSAKNNKAKATTVTWKAMSGITGYELQASMDKTFKTGVKKASAKALATSAVFKSLTKGKTWYIRVRCYKTVSGKKIYSAWGAVKAVKVTR